MPICKKCGNKFPYRININGVQKNLSNRKYCLECSPFGLHNTKQLHFNKKKDQKIKTCICGRQFIYKGTRCYCCVQKDREKNVIKKIKKITGNKCQICGYDKDFRVLDFHHLDPSKKKFNLTIRNLVNRKWSLVLEEIKKCIQVCCRCHREIEYNIIKVP